MRARLPSNQYGSAPPEPRLDSRISAAASLAQAQANAAEGQQLVVIDQISGESRPSCDLKTVCDSIQEKAPVPFVRQPQIFSISPVRFKLEPEDSIDITLQGEVGECVTASSYILKLGVADESNVNVVIIVVVRGE